MQNEWFSRIKGIDIEEVSNENMTIYFIKEEELNEAKKDLSKKIQWPDNWLIIGFDDETDDVIFINEESGKVCTAYEFERKWEVVTLYSSLNEFLAAYGY